MFYARRKHYFFQKDCEYMNNYFKFLLIIMQTTVCCFASGVIDKIENTDSVRCQLFNVRPDIPISIGGIPVNRNASIDGCTRGIKSLLETAKVSDTRATDAQRKIVMQAVMGGIVIHLGDDRFRLKAHGRKRTDKHYKHYEILRLTEQLAYDFAIKGKILATNYDNLTAFSGLSIHVIYDWLGEVFAKHSAGILIANLANHEGIPSQFVPSLVQQRSAAYAGFEDSFSANMKRNNQKLKGKSTTSMFGLPAAKVSAVRATPSASTQPNVSHASKMPSSSSAQGNFGMFFEDDDSDSSDSDDFEMPAAPSRPAASSKPFKGNWTESFRLKTGETIHHAPTHVQMGGMRSGAGLSLACKNYNGFSLQNGGLFVETDSTKEDFIAALKRSGLL